MLKPAIFLAATVMVSLTACVEQAPPVADTNPPPFKFGMRENAIAMVKDLGLSATSGIGNVGYIAGAMVVPEEWKRGHVYGKWCGAGVPEDSVAVAYSNLLVEPNKAISNHLMSFRPLDGLDRSCMVHDICYSLADSGAVLASRQDCDQDLQNGIEAGIRDGSIPVSSYPIAVKILTWVGGSYATTSIQFGADARGPVSRPQHVAPRIVEKYAGQAGSSIQAFMGRLK